MNRKSNDTMARKMYRIAYRIVRQSLSENARTGMTAEGQERQMALIEARFPGMIERIIETLYVYGTADRRRSVRTLFAACDEFDRYYW